MLANLDLHDHGVVLVGKPYSSELALLSSTYAWAMAADTTPLAAAIAGWAAQPLVAVGSGGSLTTANFASFLHERYAGTIAKAVTPLEIATHGRTLRDTVVMFVSAGGQNTDIVGALRYVVAQEPKHLLVLCGNPASPLSRLARAYRFTDLIAFDLPAGDDGFLATNSLLAFSTLLLRAYARAFGEADELRGNLGALVHPTQTEEQFHAELDRTCRRLWERENLLLLHGIPTGSAALDFESKFSEAALGPVQVADYRNFAHGRHHWLAKRGQSTAVLAIASDEDRQLADETLSLLPRDIPVGKVYVPQRGASAGIAAQVAVLHIVGLVGDSRGIDPGRPGVPLFGSRIYRSRGLRRLVNHEPRINPSEAVAIERKAGLSLDLLFRRDEMPFWRDAYRAFMEGLQRTCFDAIIFDYDGTLCDAHDRYQGLADEVAGQIERLLRAGIPIGIATGRGRSVKQALRGKIAPAMWPKVIVGYYNGADIGLLGEDSHPDLEQDPCPDLAPISEAIKSDRRLSRWADAEHRRTQISVQVRPSVPEALVWDIVHQIIHGTASGTVTVLRSSHSVDILAPHVSKRLLVERVGTMTARGERARVLCIGDKGRWPGNDFDLLSLPFSLSVDEVSADANTCWNLAPPGFRGTQATMSYLGWVRLNRRLSCFSIRVPGGPEVD